MKTFALTREAKQDLRKIAIYTERQWGKEKRLLYIKQFDDEFHFLAESPSIGKKCDHIKTGYRKFPQGSHIIFYHEVSENNILIIRILHKNMDIDSKLRDT